jgi:hypothetical protein
MSNTLDYLNSLLKTSLSPTQAQASNTPVSASNTKNYLNSLLKPSYEVPQTTQPSGNVTSKLDPAQQTKLQLATLGMQQPTQKDIDDKYKELDTLKAWQLNQSFDPYGTDTTEYGGDIKQKQSEIDALAKMVPNAQLKMSGVRAFTEPLAAGIQDFTSGIYSALEGGANVLDSVIPDNPLSKGIHNLYRADQAGQQMTEQKLQEAQVGRGDAFKAYQTVGQGVGQAVPSAALALATGGASAITQLPATAGSVGLTATVRSSLASMGKNPLFKLSFVQNYGNAYSTAKNSGATEDEAQLSAIIIGLVNSGIELTGGLETLPAALKSGNASAVKEWVKSALSEGKEEVVQGVIERLTNKMVYQKDAPLVSTTDPTAPFNPVTAAKEYAGGVAVGGILGGGQVLGSNIINATQKTRPMPPPEQITNETGKYDDAPTMPYDAPQAILTQPTSTVGQQPSNAPQANVAAQNNNTATPADGIEHIDNRTYESVGNRKVNAFQFDNPVVHPYYAEAAKNLLIDLKMGTKGQRYGLFDSEGYSLEKSVGIKRDAIPEIERLLDTAKLSYAKIEKALNDIIENHGQENYAAAKRVELIIDDILTNGYTTIDGYDIAPSEEYLQLKSGIVDGEYSMSEEDWNNLMGTMPPQNKLPGDMGAAKAGLYKTNQWSGATKFDINDNLKVDLNNLPAMSNQVNMKPQEKTGSFKSALSNAYTQVVDSLNPIVKFSKAANDNTATLASNSRNAGGTVNYIFDKALVDMNGNQIGKSLAEVVKQIPQNQQTDFWNYMLHRHNINRAVVDKNVIANYNSKMSTQYVQNVETQRPEYKVIGDEIVKWIDDFNRAWGVKSGIIDAEIYDNLRNLYTSYIPTQREFSEVEQALTGRSVGQKFVDNDTTIKTATGSARDVNNPVENIMRLVNTTVKTARYNQVGQSLLAALRNNPALTPYAEIISEKEAKASSGSNIVTVLENGKDIYIRINDKSLLEALEGLPKSTKALPIASQLVQAFKSVTTQKNPFFAVKNLTRDFQTGYIYGSENNPLKYTAKEVGAFRDIAKNTPNYQRFKAVGGGMSNFFSAGSAEQAAIDITKSRNVLQKFGMKLSRINNAVEEATRLNEFTTVYNKTGDVQKALDASNNVTVNFARGGNITKTLDKNAIPFLNASVQGLDRLAKSVKTPKALVATFIKAGIMVTIPTLILHLLDRENPYYEELSNRTKDAYYIIPNYLGDKDDNGTPTTFIKLPKSRELGALFGALFERVLRNIEGESAESAYSGIGNTLATSVAPTNPLESSMIAPLTNLKANKDFAGRTIVPESMKERSPQYQYDEKTSELTKFIAEYAAKVGVELSPKQMDYLIDSYTGVIGDIILPATTKGGDPLSVATNAFTADSTYSNQTLTDFYDKMAKAAMIASDKNFTEDIDPDTQTLEEKISGSYVKASKEISALSKISSRVGNDTMTDKDKTTLAEYGVDTTLKAEELQRAIKRQQIEIAKEAIARGEKSDEKELDLNNNKTISDKVQKYVGAGVTETQAYGLYKALSALEKANGKYKDLSNYEIIQEMAKLPINNKQKASLIATLYTSHNEESGKIKAESLLTYLNFTSRIVSVYQSSKDSEVISMQIPEKFSINKVEYVLTDTEKRMFKDAYVKLFNGYMTDMYTAEEIKKLREAALKSAKAAVYESRK